VRQYGDRKVYSVRGVVTAVWRRFQDLPSFWLEGEITNLRSSGGRQVYFTLVDTDHSDPTQIDCQMQANVFDKLVPPPGEGQLVQAYGRIEFWRGRSTVRVRVERLERSGEGLLLARIAELRARLQAEGLTSPARKRPLPFLPRRIGLITARDGAARADVISNIQRRFRSAHLVIVTTLVQGEGAPTEIASALRYLDTQPEVDVIILARGGGALEDLMAFNSEIVCRAIAGATTPVVSAIGHESDRTLSDEVADQRASTPTKAAELVVPDLADLQSRIAAAEGRALAALGRHAERARVRMTDATRRLAGGLRHAGTAARHRVDLLGTRMSPALRRSHQTATSGTARSAERLARAGQVAVAAAAARVERGGAMLELLSPERTVERGYAIVRDGAGQVVGRITDVAAGQRLAVMVRDGTLGVDVVHATPKEQS
jgi:exodeoxyribonuclease VII large subunit